MLAPSSESLWTASIARVVALTLCLPWMFTLMVFIGANRPILKCCGSDLATDVMMSPWIMNHVTSVAKLVRRISETVTENKIRNSNENKILWNSKCRYKTNVHIFVFHSSSRPTNFYSTYSFRDVAESMGILYISRSSVVPPAHQKLAPYSAPCHSLKNYLVVFCFFDLLLVFQYTFLQRWCLYIY